jgi:hypothetical protein
VRRERGEGKRGERGRGERGWAGGTFSLILFKLA